MEIPDTFTPVTPDWLSNSQSVQNEMANGLDLQGEGIRKLGNAGGYDEEGTSGGNCCNDLQFCEAQLLLLEEEIVELEDLITPPIDPDYGAMWSHSITGQSNYVNPETGLYDDGPYTMTSTLSVEYVGGVNNASYRFRNTNSEVDPGLAPFLSGIIWELVKPNGASLSLPGTSLGQGTSGVSTRTLDVDGVWRVVARGINISLPEYGYAESLSTKGTMVPAEGVTEEQFIVQIAVDNNGDTI